MAETYLTVVAGCQVLLEDLDGQLWTASTLLRHINLALEESRLKLTAAGLSRFRDQASITLPAAATELSDSTTPPLPPLFAAPILLHERRSGSTLGSDWKTVRLVSDISPTGEPGEELGVYSFQGGKLLFRGATGARELRLDFWSDLADFAGSTEAVPMDLLLAPITYLACSHAVRATDPQASDTFRRDYDRALLLVRQVDHKRKQGEVARQQQRMAGRRRRGLLPTYS